VSAVRLLSFCCVVAVVVACAPPPCDRPLTEFCDGGPCRTYDQVVANFVPADAGQCSPNVSVMTCEGNRSVGFASTAPSRFFFDADGGLLGVAQATDVVFECGPTGGSTSRTWGKTFDCSGAPEERFCSHP